MNRRLRTLAALLAIAAPLSGCGDDRAAELPALGATLNETSVSGISAGAYMAGQFQIAHSDEVVGAGIVAGGPYGCAESLYADLIP
ncbi:MAG TPA: poly(3-hydroxybutyrate) depolymerase, partial [Hyphomicrobium sp.]